MAETISITLPKELFKRLQAVKHMFNVSGVCQEAIESEVYRQELLMKGSEDMENVIERLKTEKNEYGKQYQDQGYKDGYEDAKKMSYEELIEIKQVGSGAGVIWRSEVYSNWLDDQVKDVESDEGVAFDREAYLGGWVKGVCKFFEEVKGQLD